MFVWRKNHLNKAILMSTHNIGLKGEIREIIPYRQMSRIVRKPAFCICENKDTDQLRGNREADQCLCFRFIDSEIPLLSKSKISSL